MKRADEREKHTCVSLRKRVAWHVKSGQWIMPFWWHIMADYDTLSKRHIIKIYAKLQKGQRVSLFINIIWPSNPQEIVFAPSENYVCWPSVCTNSFSHLEIAMPKWQMTLPLLVTVGSCWSPLFRIKKQMTNNNEAKFSDLKCARQAV